MHADGRSCHQMPELVQEVIDQRQNILPPFPQRRQVQRYHVQAIKQVFTKGPLTDLFLKIGVGGGDHPHIKLDRLGGTDPLHLLFLQDP